MKQAPRLTASPASPAGPAGQVTHAEMNAALDTGTAGTIAATVPWLARYQGSWWVVYEHGWLRITDTLTAADITATAARLTAPAAGPGEEEPCPPPRS